MLADCIKFILPSNLPRFLLENEQLPLPVSISDIEKKVT